MRISNLYVGRLAGLIACSVVAFIPAAGFAADDPQQKAGEYYEDALQRFRNREFDAAIIQLKNAMQIDPRNLPAMVLQGQAYIELGQGEAATTALQEAARLGADPSLLAVPSAQALILQFKHSELLEQPIPAGLPLSVRAELNLVRARAALEINDGRSLSEAIRQVEAIDPTGVDLLNLKALLALRDGDTTAAQSLTTRALELYPTNADAWLAQASIEHARGRAEQALAGYAKVLELAPRKSDARLARIGLLLDLGRDDETGADFEAMQRMRPGDPRVSYLRAVKLARAGDDHGARSALSEAMNVIGVLGDTVVKRNAQLLLVAGVCSFSLANWEAARDYLALYAQMAPAESGPRKMLGTVLMQLGDFRKATKILEEAIVATPDDVSVLMLLARAYEGADIHHKAEAVLQRLNELRSDNPQVAAKLALSRAANGEVNRALADLSNIFHEDNAVPAAGMPLAIMYLQRDDFVRAAEIAQRLLETDPDNLNFLNLTAIAKVGIGDLLGAKALLAKALKIDPDNIASGVNFAKVEVREKDYAGARERLKKVLAREPNNSLVLLELARTALAAEDQRSALDYARDAQSADPESFQIGSFLIDRYLAQGDKDAAIDLISKFVLANPENLFVLERQAEVMLAGGDAGHARSVLKNMSDLARFDAEWLTRIARTQIRVGAASDAAYTLTKAVQAERDNLPAQLLLAQLEIEQRKFDDALGRSRLALALDPNNVAAYRIQGDALRRKGSFDQAIDSYAKALGLAPDDEQSVILLHLAQVNAGRDDAALASLRDYLSRHPDNVPVNIALAELYTGLGDNKAARTHYDRLVRLLPEHPRLLNNYANLLHSLNDPAAYGFAERAYAKAPADPSVNDTLGWLLVSRGEVEQGLRYLREAQTRAPAVPDINFHVAVALEKLGRREEAAASVREALKSPQAFDGRIEAEALRRKLEQ